MDILFHIHSDSTFLPTFLVTVDAEQASHAQLERLALALNGREFCEINSWAQRVEAQPGTLIYSDGHGWRQHSDSPDDIVAVYLGQSLAITAKRG